MKIRKTLAAATAVTMIVTAAPAANAQIVAPEPSSRIEIPVDVVNFFDGISPLNRYETEQALKIGAAWILIDIALAVIGSIIGTARGALGSSLAASS